MVKTTFFNIDEQSIYERSIKIHTIKNEGNNVIKLIMDGETYFMMPNETLENVPLQQTSICITPETEGEPISVRGIIIQNVLRVRV